MGVDNNDDSMSGQVGRSEMKANSANVIEPFFGAGWDPVLSAQDGVVDFNGPPYNVAMLDSSHAVRYLSDASRLSSFGSGSFSSVMMSSFTLYNNNENVHSVCCPSDYDACYDCENETKLRSVIINTEEGHEGTNICVVAPDQEAHMTSEDRISGSLSKGKKKRCTPECESIDSPLQFTKIQQKNNSYEAVKAQNAKVEKKPKWDQSPSVNTCKAGGKQAKDQSENGGAPKEDYIHVRARRGQATNSHSLAERVRREKISERMRLLQDLVPGCNKITGKAVMLDEIINYVQSLQRQVEFLSMKLAAVNPELNFDIEQILTKDIFNSRGGGVEGQGELQTMQNSVEMLGNVISQFPPMAQFHQASSMWDDGLQSVLQVDYIPYAPLDRLEINGSMKAET